MNNDYFSYQMNDLPLLEDDELYDLIKKAQNGDSFARNKVCEHNLRLVLMIIKPFMINTDISQDLMQEGCIGLLNAIDRFDFNEGCKFSTYACYWIKCMVYKYAQANDKLIRIPSYLREIKRKYDVYVSNCKTKQGRIPSDDEIIKDLGIRQMDLDTIRSLHSEVSLDSHLGNDDEDDGDTSVLANQLGYSPNMTKNLEDEELSLIIKDVLNKFSPMDRDILISRFGLFGAKVCTFEELAGRHNCTRQNIQKHEERALTKLKRLYAYNMELRQFIRSA